MKLGQFLATRPHVVGPALARDLESLQDKMAPFPQAVAEATAPRPSTASCRICSSASARRSPPPRSRRCIAPRKSRRGRWRRRRRKGRGPASSAASPPISRRFVSSPAYAGAGAAVRGARRRLTEVVDTARALGSRSRWTSSFLGGGAFGDGGENAKEDPDFRLRRSNRTLTARDVLTLEWIDGTRSAIAQRFVPPPGSICPGSAAR